LVGIEKGTIIAVDKSRVVSRAAVPQVPDFYFDTWFGCKDCGRKELWTARQQQRWHEEQGGEIEAASVCCRGCRQQRKLRKQVAHKKHLEGVARKQVAVEEPR
jgi:hypothetical protein